MRNRFLFVPAITAIAVLFSSCTNNSSQTNSTPANNTQDNTQMESTSMPSANQDSSSGSTMMSDSEVKSFTLEAGSFYYKPNEIKVKKGDKVKVTINSVDMMHDFNIDELNVKIPVTQSGSSSSVEFTAEQAGTFEFYCSVGEHRQRGQVGKLIVEE